MNDPAYTQASRPYTRGEELLIIEKTVVVLISVQVLYDLIMGGHAVLIYQ
jgi:hypothetical protein